MSTPLDPPTRWRSRRVRIAALVAAASLGVAACGAGGTTSAGSASDSAAQSGESPTDNLFAPIEVLNIADGSTVNLADELYGGDKPVLLWFFAPH